MKYLIFFLLITFGFSKQPYSLDHEIAQVLLLGFEGATLKESPSIKKDIQAGLGSIILFDGFQDKSRGANNVKSPKQLKKLISDMQALSPEPLLTCIDQEGGTVTRLKEEIGFLSLPSAESVGTKDSLEYSKNLYAKLASELKDLGINCVFAPVVDLAIEPKNPVIFQRQRSYSADPKIVAKHAEIFMDAMRDKKIFSIIKHFPGHGSSLSDSHKGFVDVSDTWKEVELEPFVKLIDKNKVEMIMTAHIFNKHIDSKYPATMSYNTNTKLLKNKLGFKGLMISDGLQMHAISKNFSLEETVEKTLNSGVDILLFANQLGFNSRDELVGVVKKLIKQKKLSEESIRRKAERIRFFKRKIFDTL
ncbi:MAG: glycoside hydrolase family 3 protein [Thiovulaceae bacterium]|nr:glycoside hydrolase family 3 protein [Sulfurimonadaceae bacterium]